MQSPRRFQVASPNLKEQRKAHQSTRDEWRTQHLNTIARHRATFAPAGLGIPQCILIVVIRPLLHHRPIIRIRHDRLIVSHFERIINRHLFSGHVLTKLWEAVTLLNTFDPARSPNHKRRQHLRQIGNVLRRLRRHTISHLRRLSELLLVSLLRHDQFLDTLL